MIKKILTVLFMLAFLVTGYGCENSEESQGIKVVATLFPQYDFAKAIIGDEGNVDLLLTPGSDSHSFELTSEDILSINKCDVFIYTGPNMEIWVDSIIDSVDEGVTVLNLSSGIELKHTEPAELEEHDHIIDPHIWTSPVIAMEMLKKIYNAICAVDPDNKDVYTDNYNVYLGKLKNLDESFRNLTEDHAYDTLYFSGKFAFKYFFDEYQLNYYAPFNSCSDLQVEDLASVAYLISEMKEREVKYIFYEEFATADAYSTIARETGAAPLLLHSAHNVSSDDFKNGITYVDLMNNNLINLQKALG